MVAFLGVSACAGGNYLEEFSSSQSDEALYEEALSLVNNRAYDEALTQIQKMSTSGQNRTDVIQTLAGIYAGKCGLDFLEFVTRLGNGGSVFGIFMSGFQGTAVNPADCQTAQTLIETKFGTTGILRTGRLGSRVGSNVNTFMAVLGMAKIGVQLRSTADKDGPGNNGNGTVDAGYNACQQASINNAGIAAVGTGFALILDNFTAIASNLSGSNASLITDLQAACALIPGTNPCTISNINDPAWADAGVQTAIRGMIRSSSLGIQNCNNVGVGAPFNCCP